MTGRQFRRIRKRMGLTQIQFSKEMCWHSNSVARAERDEVGISPTAAKLARLLLAIHEGKLGKVKKRRT